MPGWRIRTRRRAHPPPSRPSLLFTPYSSMHVPCLRSGKDKWEMLDECVLFLEQDFMDIQL